ncbi:phosphopantetheine-binding protein [Streptomyces himastatinicus]|uniref:acyl carrier protein n=1 Tax=Streptomyces himastatinicus TaxID=998084 RepID=UPI0001B4F491
MTTVEPTAPAPATTPDAPAVLADVAGMLRTMLDEDGLDDIEVAMDTRFTDDLELESIDLVTLAGTLQDRYGQEVNFAEFVADLELDEIIGLTVGQLVQYIVRCLSTAQVRAVEGS